jgi:methylase of polypeptide subunit release factors
LPRWEPDTFVAPGAFAGLGPTGSVLVWLSHRPPGIVVDVGCGNGAQLTRSRDAGCRAIGLELAPDAARACRTMGHLTIIGTTLTASRILIRNNLFADINGQLFQILSAPADLVIERHMGVSRNGVIVADGAATPNLVLWPMASTA